MLYAVPVERVTCATAPPVGLPPRSPATDLQDHRLRGGGGVQQLSPPRPRASPTRARAAAARRRASPRSAREPAYRWPDHCRSHRALRRTHARAVRAQAAVGFLPQPPLELLDLSHQRRHTLTQRRVLRSQPAKHVGSPPHSMASSPYAPPLRAP